VKLGRLTQPMGTWSQSLNRYSDKVWAVFLTLNNEKSLAALHIAKLSKTSFNGSLPGFSALLVMTFYLVLVTDNVHSTSRPSCSDLLCDFFNTG